MVLFQVPETDDKLEWACGVAGNKLITCYMQHVKNTLQLRYKTVHMYHCK